LEQRAKGDLIKVKIAGLLRAGDRRDGEVDRHATVDGNGRLREQSIVPVAEGMLNPLLGGATAPPYAGRPCGHNIS